MIERLSKWAMFAVAILLIFGCGAVGRVLDDLVGLPSPIGFLLAMMGVVYTASWILGIFLPDHMKEQGDG